MTVDINKKDSKLMSLQNWISIRQEILIIKSNQMIPTAEKEM